ncbi:MAG: hypothetical protein JWR52_3130 [Marmoricola sp.]|nr:hypothetical protein [Marmoricola sp.]
MRRATPFLLVLLAVPVLAGCQSVPSNASVKAFCSSGDRFSASTRFDQGVAAAKNLAKVGTPVGINADARAGFIELINRVTSAHDGNDFTTKSRKLTVDEQKHLVALTNYIAKTCTDTASMP